MATALLRKLAAAMFLFTFMIPISRATSAQKRQSDGQTFQKGMEAYELTDWPAAFKLLQSPAEQGNPKAEYALGLLYLEGYYGTVKDEKKGMLWIEKAAKASDPDACLQLSGNYLNGDNGLPLNLEAALKWRGRATAAYEALAAKGDPYAAKTLGDQAKDDAEKYRWYRAAYQGFLSLAQKGNIPAMKTLGDFYNYGYGMDKDPNEARKWYLAAINKIIPMTKHGDAALMLYVGNLYVSSMQDYPHALGWYEKAAGRGSGLAAAQVGWYYHLGFGIKSDDKEAVQWYQKSVKLGYWYGLNYLAGAYENGQGVPQNGQEAIRLYQQCADKGDPYCLVDIGDMYQNGTGVEKDTNQAIQWYERASASGEKNEGSTLGDLYRDGRGVGQDYKEALHWYQSCPGYWSCNLEAGKILADGKAGTPDPYGAFGALRLFWYQYGNGSYHPEDFYDAWGETVSSLKKLASAGDAPASKILAENAELIADVQQAADQVHQKDLTDAKAKFDSDLKSLESNQDFLKVWNGGYGDNWRNYLEIDYQEWVIQDALALKKLNAEPDTPADVEANIKTARDKAKNATTIQDYVDAENLLKSAIMAAPWRWEPYVPLANVEEFLHQYQASADLWKEAMEADGPDADPEDVKYANDQISQMKAKADAHQKAVQIVQQWSSSYSSNPTGAIQSLSQAVQIDPDYVGAHIWLAWAYYANKQYEDAYDTAENAWGVIKFGQVTLTDDFEKNWAPEGFRVTDYMNEMMVMALSTDFARHSPDQPAMFYLKVINCCPGVTQDYDGQQQQALAHYNLGIILLNLQSSEVANFLDGAFDCNPPYHSSSYSDCSREQLNGYDITDDNQKRQAGIYQIQQAVQLDPGNSQYQQTLNNMQGGGK